MKIRNWMVQKSETFSRLCDEELTHKEVIVYHVVFALLSIGVIAVADAPLLAAASIAVAGGVVMMSK